MTPDLDDRVLRLACRAVDMYGLLESRGGAAREVARQYLRAATSVGANCAEAAAGQTKADFIAKVSIARKECREVIFWLRLIEEKAMVERNVVRAELSRARQLAAVLTAIVKAARSSDTRGPGIP